MKRIRVKSLVVLCSLLLLGSGAMALSGQMGEAEMAKALDQVGRLLGLPPISPEELKRKVEQVGGLGFETDVPVDFMPREDLARYIRELFEEEYPREYAEREELMLRSFGFLSPEEDLREIREKVLNENVAGFYDERPGVKKLFAISSGRELNVMNQLILAHELRHALQDQHVVIREMLEVESDYDDRRLAALCLLEGDASVVMERYLQAGATQNRPEMAGLFQVFSQSLTGEQVAEMFAGPALRDAPPVIQEQLIAPYFEGRRFASFLHEKGGFALLNEKLRRPPRSMEQVLHPEKYVEAVDEPVAVSLPEVRDAEPAFEGTLGEFLIRVLLRQGPGAEAAEQAAAGWGGDRYAVLPGEGSSYTLIWRTAWDTEKDAEEFAKALETYARSRFPGEGTSVRRESPSVVTLERSNFH